MVTVVSGNDQREGNAVAVLESTGSKGSVLVNGTLVKKSTSCVLNSGDEVVFGLLGNHAYVFQQLHPETAIKGAEVQSGGGKLLQIEKRTESELDGMEGNSTPNEGIDKATDTGASDKNSPMDCDPDDAVIEAGNVLEERNGARDTQAASSSGTSVLEGLMCSVFKTSIPLTCHVGTPMSQVSIGGASSAFFICSEGGSWTEGLIGLNLRNVRDLNVFSNAQGRKCPRVKRGRVVNLLACMQKIMHVLKTVIQQVNISVLLFVGPERQRRLD
ncbi:uncharacterized protein LOC107460140 [Arachis duranensis]|uniref:Uncharacterized protein LOC107460140 n=1 Tax=Arachis duranensis TaxID=130453 RepID=A0A9C6TI61_ARADU|nr:uncharacterized protein LOC107460140 [Arachis duranensis]